MIRVITYQALPMPVVIGVGSLATLPHEVEAMGLSRVLEWFLPCRSRRLSRSDR